VCGDPGRVAVTIDGDNFGDNFGSLSRARSLTDRILAEILEAPPGFEPGMEVLQISQSCLSC
jgi:hypothetical protein